MTHKIGLGLPTRSYILKNTDKMRTEENDTAVASVLMKCY